MEWNKIHKSFRLSGCAFNSVNELLTYSVNISKEFDAFLKEWFNSEKSIKVKTSGSTGVPKEILLKKEYIINSAKATGLYFNLPNKTTALLCLPTSYIAGKLMLVRALILGWEIDYIKASVNPLKDINKQYDFTAMTPMQLENSLSKLHFIKKIIVGGGVVSKTLENKLKNVKTKVFATYGMTETITHVAVKPLNNFKIKSNFYQVLPNVKVYVDSRNCLVIKAPKVSDKTIFTNDIVQLISSNHFNWLGRFDNVINSGGIKLQPEIIEEKLSNIITSRFFVVGIADDVLGEKLVLIVEGEQQKIPINKTNLTAYEKPKEIYFIKNFIETTSGKVQRLDTLKHILTQK